MGMFGTTIFVVCLLVALCGTACSFSLQQTRLARSKSSVSMFFGGGGGGGGAGGDSVLGDIKSFPRPKKTLILFEYESSAPSKVVRQACQLLDLIVEHRPCPGGRYGFSDNLQTKSLGSRTTPYLIDPGNPIAGLSQAKNSGEIVEYLYTYYGPGADKIPSSLKGKGLTNPSGTKPLKDWNEDNILLKPMLFYGWENNGDCEAIREVFSGLCIPFVNVNVAQGSKNRPILEKKLGGSFKIPYMEDPNTRKNIVGKNDIKAHLMANYANGVRLKARK